MKKIKKVGVLGSGLMGSGIAEIAARAGYETVVREVSSELVDKGVEKTAKGKAEIVKALNEAFAYCEAAYADLTDAKAAETVKFFGMAATRLGIMDFNVAHNMEHYGNLVTYMRLKGIVPPSSAPRPVAPAKK